MNKDLLKGISDGSESEKKISSGVYMSVWQQMPARPEVQVLIHQQQEIEAIKNRLDTQDKRLTRIEKKFQKLEAEYRALVKALKNKEN